MNLLKLIIFSLGLLAIQACQDSQMRDLKSFVADAYKDQQPKIEPLPEIKPYKGFEYAAFDEADPFNSGNIKLSRDGESPASGLRPDNNRRKEPLELYPLDALVMVGTMSQNEVPWVIVQTAEGTAHRATLGNYLGQNEGKITRIILEEQKVVLTELVVDPAGRWVNRDVEITIDEN